MNFILDSDVLIGVLRQYPPALVWQRSHAAERISIPSVDLMEIQQGSKSKHELQKTLKALKPFPVAHVTDRDSLLALQLHKSFVLSHGMSIPDAFVAAIAVNRDATLLTLNLKHFDFVPGIKLVAPYS